MQVPHQGDYGTPVHSPIIKSPQEILLGQRSKNYQRSWNSFHHYKWRQNMQKISHQRPGFGSSSFKQFQRLLAIVGIAFGLVCAGIAPAQAEIRVMGLGVPGDASKIQAAVLAAAPGETIRLIGTFDMTNLCVACVVINKPVTIQGSNCGIGGLGTCTNATATIKNGVMPFIIAQTVSGTAGILVKNLYFHHQILGPSGIFRSLGLVEFDDNKVDNQTALPVATTIGLLQVRTGLGSIQPQLFTADPNVAAMYPALKALDNIPRLIQGAVVYKRNTVDLITNATKPGLAEDNGITAATCENSAITMIDNVVKTFGDGIELEGCTNSNAVITITGNKVTLNATRNTEGTMYGWGSPAAIKMQTLAGKSATVSGNIIAVSGYQTATAITAGTTNPLAVWNFQSNSISTQGQLAAFVGGSAGVPPFFLGASLSHGVISGNTFSGSAGYGVAFKDVPTFVNTGTANQIKGNTFTAFTPTTGYTIYLGAGTRNNTIQGPLHGSVYNLGLGNVFLP
jgi:hypothetical protein